MSWKDRLMDIPFEIITRDGSVFKPLWKNAVKNVKYNTEGFDFVGVPGSYVERKERSGNQYPLLFYFQGEDCIEQARNFDIATSDKRPLKIKHPFLGEFKCQPLSWKFDYSSYNVVQITGVVWETLSNKYPQKTKLPNEDVFATKVTIESRAIITITKSIVKATAENIRSTSKIVEQIGAKYKLLVQTDTEAADLRNRIRLAQSGAQNILEDIENYTRQAINLINFPFDIAQDIDTKVDLIIENIETLADIFLRENDKDKELYEFQSAIMLSELARNVVDADYETIGDVFNTIDRLSSIYESVLDNMEGAGYIQDSELSNSLDVIINTSFQSLYDQAFESKQERTVLIPEDSNVIVLAHKYYGPGDDNFNEFVERNGIGVNELLQVNKGREIIYFV